MSSETTSTLKLSKSTIEVLKWCELVQPTLFIGAGSRIRSMTLNGPVALDANVDQVFPCNWGIWNLREVLRHLHEDTDIRFDADGAVQLRNGNKSLQLENVPEHAIYSPSRELRVDFDEAFFLHADDVYELRKLVRATPGSATRAKGARAGLVRPIVLFDSSSDTRALRIHYCVEDVNAVGSPSSQRHTIEPTLNTIPNSRWRVAINASLLKLREGSYDVSISRRGLMRFSWLSGDVTLYVLIEQSRSSVDDTPLTPRPQKS